MLCYRVIFMAIACGLLLSACAYDNRVGALPSTARYVWSGPPKADQQPLKPGQHYLRVRFANQVAVLVLGHSTPSPAGDTETWLSAKGEVLKIRNGRIIETDGLDVDWRQVQLPELPDWTALEDRSFSYKRSRDVMPGYQYGLTDRVTDRPISPRNGTQLKKLDPTRLHWFVESSVPLTPNTPSLPPTFIALAPQGDHWQAVYGEQSLSPQYRLTWQRWPAE